MTNTFVSDDKAEVLRELTRYERKSLVPELGTMLAAVVMWLIIRLNYGVAFLHIPVDYLAPMAFTTLSFAVLWLISTIPKEKQDSAARPVALWRYNAVGYSLVCLVNKEGVIESFRIVYGTVPNYGLPLAIIIPLGGCFNRPRLITPTPTGKWGLNWWRFTVVAIHIHTGAIMLQLINKRTGERVNMEVDLAADFLTRFVLGDESVGGDWGGIVLSLDHSLKHARQQLAEAHTVVADTVTAIVGTKNYERSQIGKMVRARLCDWLLRVLRGDDRRQNWIRSALPPREETAHAERENS